MSNAAVLAERVVHYLDAKYGWTSIALLLFMVICFRLAFEFALDDTPLFVISLVVGGISFIAAMVITFCGIVNETQYLIQVTDETNVVEFNRMYYIEEALSDKLFWCTLK